jgi:hypothetical protein
MASMQHIVQNILYKNATKCWESVLKSIYLFKELLKENVSFRSEEYDQAVNILHEANQLYKETLKSAQKLLGPSHSQVSDEYLKWRDQLLDEFRILAVGQEFRDLQRELLKDKHLRRWMTEEEIAALLMKHFQTQQSGKRKLSNIKVRIILDHLDALLIEAFELNREVVQKRSSSL